jgi:hypothetical protein
MNITPYEKLTAEHVQYLLEGKPHENRFIDYKRDLPAKEDELLKDVSAFANTQGGVIVFGIQDKGGVPDVVFPVSADDLDKEFLRMENWIRAGLDPSLSEFHFDTIYSEQGRIVALRIPPSPNAPHMIAKGTPKFYSRGAAGNTPMDAHEIRSAFLASENLIGRVREFRNEREQLIDSNDLPFELEDTRVSIFHIIPLSSIQRPRSFSINELKDALGETRPLGSPNSWAPRVCLEGMAQLSGSGCRPKVKSYTLLFRTGIIEAVCPCVQSLRNSTTVFLHEYQFIKSIHGELGNYAEVLSRLNVTPPLLLCMTYLNVENAYVYCPEDIFPNIRGVQMLRSAKLQFPAVEVNTMTPDPDSYLHSMSNLLANATGLLGSPLFKDGRLVGKEN